MNNEVCNYPGTVCSFILVLYIWTMW